MKRSCLCFLCLCGLIGWACGQSSSDSVTVAAYVEEARQMTQYLAYVFNTLGDPSTSQRDKETIINQSYLKVFRDPEVQIEDDLVPDRSTVTNKDVQAYLKDIDFFFQSVRFDFLIESITPYVNEQGGGYLTVALERRMRGVAIDGDSVNHSQPRFIEINFYPESRLLKIASIYTSRLSEQEDLRNWWQSLDSAWRGFLAPDIQLNDTLTLADLLRDPRTRAQGDTLLLAQPDWVELRDSADLLLPAAAEAGLQLGDSLPVVRYDTFALDQGRFYGQLRQLMRKRSLDLSGRTELRDLSPLSKLRQLRDLTLSHTHVRDLTPLRNLAYLTRLDLSHTQVGDLSPLRYCDALQRLDISHTLVDDLTVVADLPQLQRLTAAHTAIQNLDPLAEGPSLVELNLSGTSLYQVEALAGQTQLVMLDLSRTNLYDLRPLADLPQLRVLNCERTSIADLSPLAQAQALRLLRVDSTNVLSLRPLRELPDLQKIYCDHTHVGRLEVERFRQARPDVMIVFASASLREWWNSLPLAWQALLWPEGEDDLPDREQLHAISQMDSLDLSGRKDIRSLQPLRALARLHYLDLSFTSVDSLGPLSEAEALRYLDCSHSQVRSLDPLRYLRRLHTLKANYTVVQDLLPLTAISALQRIEVSGTQVSNLVPLFGLSGLRQVEADDTPLSVASVQAFLQEQPACLVIFQTNRLQTWWQTLPATWQRVLRQAVDAPATPTTLDWHRMIYLVELTLQQQPDISSLTPLQPFMRLERLYLTGTGVTHLAPLTPLTTLNELAFPAHRVRDLSPLRRLDQLTLLNCENTPVEDLAPLSSLFHLETLNCAGTQVDELDALEGLFQLRRVNCSNTRVKKLKPLYTLPRLETISCFNTRVSERRVEKFRETRPQVEIIYY